MRECFICGSSTDVNFYCALASSQYMRCEKCGLIFIDPLPSTNALYPSYSGGVWKSFRRRLVAPFRGFTQVRNFAQSMKRAQRIFTFAASFLNESINQPVLLDIGCNKGFLLATAIERGWDIHGVEIIPELTIPFRKKFKSVADHIHAGRFADTAQSFSDALADVVTAIDVIEHFEEPVQNLQNIYRILKPEGISVIQTPDGACHRARQEKEKWGALKPLEHLQIFSRKSLEKLAARIGFIKVEFYEPFEEADGNLLAVLRKPGL